MRWKWYWKRKTSKRWNIAAAAQTAEAAATANEIKKTLNCTKPFERRQVNARALAHEIILLYFFYNIIYSLFKISSASKFLVCFLVLSFLTASMRNISQIGIILNHIINNKNSNQMVLLWKQFIHYFLNAQKSQKMHS